MQGHNSINLCPAEMVRAMQHYFDTVALKEKVKVTDVAEDRGGVSKSGFTIKFQEEEVASISKPKAA